MLYGDLNKPGPYLVMMKWNPGWYSAPHNYRTDRICVVVSGTWWVESGADFTPLQTVPVAAGGYVLRHARTWHYDGVPANGKEPAMIAKPLPSLTLQATSYTASVAYRVKVDFKAWMLPEPRQKESTIPLGSEKWKAPWHRTAIDRGAWFPTRAGSSPGV